jgi:hypothetical protein
MQSALVGGCTFSIICRVGGIIYKVVFCSAGCRGKSISCTSSVSLITFQRRREEGQSHLFRQATMKSLPPFPFVIHHSMPASVPP